jgi:hypothetical protein
MKKYRTNAEPRAFNPSSAAAFRHRSLIFQQSAAFLPALHLWLVFWLAGFVEFSRMW